MRPSQEAVSQSDPGFLHSSESRRKDGTWSFVWHTDSTGGHTESMATIGVWGRELTLVQHDLGEKQSSN